MTKRSITLTPGPGDKRGMSLRADVQNPSDALGGVAGITAAYASIVTDIATLVTDAGSPTQAHVTTLAADWVTLKAVLDALVTGAAAAVTQFNKGIVLQVDDVLAPATLPVDLNALKATMYQ
jgi:hypothetical protein